MDQVLKEGIQRAAAREPFARQLGITLEHLDLGHSIVKMKYTPETMDNIYCKVHGGALFALIDEAFETASQTHGTIAVALNVNVTYVSTTQAGDVLRAEAKEIVTTRKTATYDIKITNQMGKLIATCQALAYNTGKPVPFITT
jgi:acyl-CoA thioesterase